MPQPRDGKHGANKLSSYFQIHQSILNRLVTEGFVGGHDTIVEVYEGFLRVQGWIACKGRIVITFDKLMMSVGERDGDTLIQTEMYAYNALLQGKHNILRYDNQHPDAMHDGHCDPHHKHVFDFSTGDELTSPQWIGEAEWPTLSAVIEELREWHAANYHCLPAPEEYATKPDRWP